ncbi:B12-binding domain-containing radical SAM protein [Abyssisolibacter fermentans]|uniref:B12-binding domain-containing radical SAM protein n=1 Tax=Abyssisolibacter fermentans TaxID=1766203 RepID=UPI0008336B0E|nr:radical SAM protein [Abyssisolibacter fermentans]
MVIDKKDFKILLMSIPRVVYDRNLHDRCTDFGETGQYIIERYTDDSSVKVDIVDCAILNYTLRSIYRMFEKKYDLVILYTDLPDSKLTIKLANALKYISPNSKAFVYGDATLTIPVFFKEKPIDAVHLSGDQEAVIYRYIEYLRKGDESLLKGVSIVHEDGTFTDYNGDIRIHPDEWAYPPIELLPIDEYKKFARVYKNGYYTCSIYVSKGCSNKCQYCLCGKREGFTDRRRDVLKTVDFIDKYKDRFDRFKLHSADLFKDKEWIVKFCEEILRRKLNIKWKGTVCLQSLDIEIAKLCAKAGCYGLGFGIETFYKDDGKGVKISVNEFEEKMKQIAKIPIMWKGFVMLGIEGQKISDIDYTIEILRKYGVIIRPSTYTPYYKLKDLSVEELKRLNLEDWNKKEYVEDKNSVITRKLMYKYMGISSF